MFGFKKKEVHPTVGAVIVAGGSSSRMGGINKQLEYIGDLPTIGYSLIAFEENPYINQIVLVCSKDSFMSFMKVAKDLEISKLKSIVVGGSSRQQSVQIGIEELSEDMEYYCIHDGARPLITQRVIDTTIEDAFAFKSATAAVKVKDTIKVARDNFVTDTPNREELYSIQTPQVFHGELYREAREKAKEQGKEYTDDCQLVEAIGKVIYLSQGDYSNLKITTPEDLIIARALMEYGE